MSFLGWMTLAGGVLLLMALSSAYLRTIPVSTSVIYLAIGAGLLWAEHGGPGGWIGGWALHRVVWAVPAGLLLGFCQGRAVG